MPDKTIVESRHIAGRRAAWTAFGGNTLDNFDAALFTFLIPVLGKLWAMNRAEAGFIATITIATGAIGGVAAGALADRWGRTRTLQLTIIAFSVMTFLCGFAQGPISLLVLRGVQGFGFGGELAVGAVLVGEWVNPARRGRVMGMVASGFAIGSTLAFGAFALVSALLPPTLSWRVLFWIGVLPAALVIYVRRNVTDAPRPHADTPQAKKAPSRVRFTALFSTVLRRRTIAATLLVMGITGAQTTFVIWLPTLLQTERGFSMLATGGNYLANSVGAFLGFVTGGVVSDRLGRRRGFQVTVLVAFAAIIAYLFAPLTSVMLVPLGVVVGLLIVTAGVAITPFLVELFPPPVRGAGTGFGYSVGRGAGAIFPAVVGVVSMRAPLAWSIAGTIAVAYLLVLAAVAALPETHLKAEDWG